MAHMTRPWLPAEDDLLMDLVAEDIPFRDIAKRLGRTRNACIGRMFRIRKEIERKRAYDPTVPEARAAE